MPVSTVFILADSTAGLVVFVREFPLVRPPLFLVIPTMELSLTHSKGSSVTYDDYIASTPTSRRHSLSSYPSHPPPVHDPSVRRHSVSLARALPPSHSMVPSLSSRPLSTQWFFGPATGSTLLPRRMTSLEREINRDEQQIQMYGGDCIHEPPPKAPLTPSVSFDEQETEESGGQKPEEGLPAHSFLSPSATLDGNLVGWDGPDDPKNPQNWSFKYKCFITFCCILMALDGCVFFLFHSRTPDSLVYL